MISSVIDNTIKFYVRYFPVSKGKVRLVEFLHKIKPFGKKILFFTDFGVRMKLDLSQYIHRQIYFSGAYEKNILHLMNVLNEYFGFRVMVDVGANEGHHSLYAAKVLKIPQVIAFEADSNTYEKLCENIKLNGFLSQIRPINKAISDKNSYITIVKPSPGNNGMNYIAEKYSSENNATHVSSIKLDEYLARVGLSEIGLLKIDVEGAEAKVLRGAKGIIQGRGIKAIIVEICQDNLSRFSDYATELVEFLESNGYEGLLVEDRKIKIIDRKNIRKFCEVLFVRKRDLSHLMKLLGNDGYFVVKHPC